MRKRAHGHLVTRDINIEGLSIERTLNQLKKKGWNATKLSVRAKETYIDCRFNEISNKLKECQDSDQLLRETVKKHILNLYDDEVGKRFSCLYLLCYINKIGVSVSLIVDMKEYLNREGFFFPNSLINKCIKKAMDDGIYLSILNSDGTIKDNMFVMDWGYYYENKLLNSVISSIKSQLESDDEKDWYTELHRNRHVLNYRIEKRDQFNFSVPIIDHKKIKKDEKIRQVYLINKKSPENVLIKYIKRNLDIVFEIEYPNRNVISRELFALIKDIHKLSSYTIYRFDIKDFFDSVSSKDIFEKYIKDTILDANLKKILSDFVSQNEQCYAGIASSNALIEIAGKKFDHAVKTELYKYGLIFYARYVDDGIIIVNSNVEKSDVLSLVEKNVKKYFGEQVTLNINKEKYITKNAGDKFNYLGYLYSKENDKFKFGIEEQKIIKYQKVIDKIVDAYLLDHNQELLRHRIRFFISRIVYYNKQAKDLDWCAWDVRGISANYSLLHSAILENNVESNTITFLKNGIYATLRRKTCGSKLYFINCKTKDNYSIETGIKQKKSIVFNPKIGWSKEYLKKQLEKLGYRSNKNYDELVKLYCSLIKVC